jgi:kynurenine formamidase
MKKMKFIDLSIPIANGLNCDPGPGPTINYSDHNEGASGMVATFPELRKDDLPDGKGWAVENITLSTHHGTHMDSPYHYFPTQDNEISKRNSLTIDEIPLEWCIAPLIVLDCTDLEDGYVLRPSDLDDKLNEINHELARGDIVCIHTNAAKHLGTNEFIHHGVGVGKDGTLHLVRRGIHIVGTDAWSWDAPFSLTAAKWVESVKNNNPNPSLIWEGHFAGIERGYCQIEKMTNLDKVPPVGATLYCFPVKIDKASAGWVRAVATVP